MTDKKCSDSRLLRVSEGLAILARHSGKFDINADHDVIYAGPEKAEDVPREDADCLKALGWIVSSEYGCWMYFT